MMDEPISDVVAEETEPVVEAPVARFVLKESGAETDSTYPLAHGAIVGRFDPALGPVDVDCAELSDGNTVSRRHAKIEQGDSGWSFTDLGSSNGSYVLRDGQFERVEMADLTEGTEVAFGKVVFVFREG